ncbi:MAG: hypothetical protein GXP54_08040 [Deltaproteobacteria bacterium]|nr:hypothetical protein [Deltaproteobacteria bacterium]
MNPRFSIHVVLVFLFVSAPAFAGEIWTSDDEEMAVQYWGYLKNQALGMHSLGIDLYPEEVAGQDTTKIRLGLKFDSDVFRAGLEYEFRFTFLSDGMEGGATSLIGSTAPRPRLWDVGSFDGPNVLTEHDIDRYWVAFSAGPVDITLGRQAITWGSSWFWKPTDRFSPFSPMDVDPDVKRGVDAARVEIYTGQTSKLDLVTTFERHPGTDREYWVHGGARFRMSLGGYDLALSAARFQMADEADWMVGFEFSGSIEKVGFRGEAAFNYMQKTGDWDIEAVIGADYHFPFKLTLAGEFFFNGYGAADPDGYNEYLMSPGTCRGMIAGTAFEAFSPLCSTMKGERLERGEAFQMGRYYLGITAVQEVHPLVSLTLTSITNLRDPSTLLIFGLRWSVIQDVRLTAGVLVPLGEKPDVTTDPTGAFQLVDAKSEFGLMPVLGYAVIKFSF